MTERLATLLRDEAEGLSVPAPDASRALDRGRTLRRRRRATLGSAAAALVVVAGLGGGLLIDDDDDDDKAVDPDPVASALDRDPVFALGRTLYLDGATRRVEMDEIVQTIYYTSAGLLLRTNETGASDGGAPFHLALVGSDGTATPLDLTLGEVVPSTDPTQPYLAYTDLRDGTPQVVVRDVSTDEEVARVDLPDLEEWGGWEAPPVALDGDTVYVGGGDTSWAVDWRTGAVQPAEHLAPGHPVVEGGHALAQGNGTNVVDVETGDTLLTTPAGWLMLSPDGRYAMASDMDRAGDVTVWNVETGRSVEVPGSSSGFGWTPEGDVFTVDATRLRVCDPDAGSCTERDVDVPPPSGDEFVRLGGTAYES